MDRVTLTASRSTAARGALASIACAAALAAPLRAQAESFDAILPLVGERRYLEALERADGFQDRVLASQARLWILYSAGDLRGGLAAGLAGLRAAPEEAWLLEQSADLAGNLAAAELMSELVARLERVSTVPADRLDALRERADRLLASVAARSASMRRARATVLAFAALSLLATVLLARRGARRPRVEDPGDG